MDAALSGQVKMLGELCRDAIDRRRHDLERDAKLVATAQEMSSALTNEDGTPKFSEKDLKNLRWVFEKHDADDSGEIDDRELMPLLKELLVDKPKAQRPNKLQVKRLAKDFDTDGTGKLNFAEFCHLVLAMRQGEGTKFTDRFVPNALVSNIKHEKKKKGETGFGPDSGLSDTRQTYRSSMRASDARLDR